MGTETCTCTVLSSSFRQSAVKLNNPQMGTETSLLGVVVSPIKRSHVKLNNPQMGTETALRFIFLCISFTV